MSIEGFTYDARHDLWIADGSAGLDWADGSEAYLQRIFEGEDVVSDYPFELAGFIHDWPSRYHLSHLRVNLMEAVRPLLQSSWRVLELGGGTGVITKWLAQAVAEVDTLEGSLERARVNRLRTRGDGNARVFVGDMVAAPFPGKYDLATLVGVLEYTPPGPGTTRRQACLELLRKIRGSLAENGVLMVAIENRLGAKYWAGCGEDHSARLFDGLLGYPDDSPVTFSRRELEALLREAGFEYQQFYHLHPDYKLPTTVIRETEELARCSLHQWTRSLAEDYAHPREYLLPDPLLMKSVEDAGLFWQFSNSFLVMCSPSRKAVLATDWLAKRFANSTRPELHHTITLVKRGEEFEVERAPLRCGRSPVDLGDYAYALSDGKYLSGSLLVMEAYKALMSQRWFENLTELCREVLEAARSLFAIDTAPDQGNFDLLAGSALDFTFWNIIRQTDGALDSFDSKWSRKEPLPGDYVLFRSLFHFLHAGAPFLQVGFHEAITSLLRHFYPTFDDARFVRHMEAEKHLQECVYAQDFSHSFLDDDGQPMVPPTRADPLPNASPPAPIRRLHTTAPARRTKVAGAFGRLLLGRLGLSGGPRPEGRRVRTNMVTSPRVTVVIPNWNGLRHLPECLGTLAEQSFRDFEVVLVDNASIDGGVAWTKEHHPEVCVLERSDNGGFAKAVNDGILSSQSEYVALLNNDTAVDAGWLEALVGALDDHPLYDFGASKMLLYYEPGLVNAAGDTFALLGMAGENRGFREPASRYDKMERVLGACAGAALYRRALFAQVGLFDEDFFLMHEDTDFNLRCLIAGKRCLYVPTAQVRHKWRSSIDTEPLPEMTRLLARNAAIVAAKDLPTGMLLPMLSTWGYRAFRNTIPLRPSKWHLVPTLLRRAPELFGAEAEGYRMGLAKRPEVWRLKAVSTREILRWLRKGYGPV